MLVGGFWWIENTFQIGKGFTENYDEDIDKGYCLEVYVQYSETFHSPHNDLPFLSKRIMLGESWKNF